MLETLDIQGFRAFPQLTMAGLGRVNLLIGRNNCGKTSVLEALYIALSQEPLGAMSHICSTRGEHLPVDADKSDLVLEVNHLFHGNQVYPGACFQIEGRSGSGTQSLTATVGDPDEEEGREFLRAVTSDIGNLSTMSRRLALALTFNDPVRNLRIVFDADGNFSLKRAYMVRFLSRNGKPETSSNVRLITTDGLRDGELLALWDRIQLTEQETSGTRRNADYRSVDRAAPRDPSQS